MEDCLAGDIVEFEFAHLMWAFLRDRYEFTRQSSYLVVIHQEHLLRQVDSIDDELFAQMPAIWRQLDALERWLDTSPRLADSDSIPRRKVPPHLYCEVVAEDNGSRFQ